MGEIVVVPASLAAAASAVTNVVDALDGVGGTLSSQASSAPIGDPTTMAAFDHMLAVWLREIARVRQNAAVLGALVAAAAQQYQSTDQNAVPALARIPGRP